MLVTGSLSNYPEQRNEDQNMLLCDIEIYISFDQKINKPSSLYKPFLIPMVF